MTQVSITISELPNERLKMQAMSICENEKRNPENIRFYREKDDDAYMEFRAANEDDGESYLGMFEGDIFTCFGWYVNGNEID